MEIEKKTTEVPEWLLEMSKQMNEQPNRATAHPFWQVRCNEYVVTAKGYNESHFVISDGDGVFFDSRKDTLQDISEYLLKNHEDHFNALLDEEEEEAYRQSNTNSEDLAIFNSLFERDFSLGDYDFLPDDCDACYMQEVEKVVSTHLTEFDAKAFIARKQHDYPKLYTYVASAYWAPQLKQLQDWIISLKDSQ